MAALCLAAGLTGPAAYAQPASCDLPTSGPISTATTYNLTDNCIQTGTLHIRATVTINGNGTGKTISGASITSGNMFEVQAGGTLVLNNVTISGLNGGAAVVRINVSNSDRTFRFNKVTFSGNTVTHAVIWITGSLAFPSLAKIRFEGNRNESVAANRASSILNTASSGFLAVSDLHFKDNSGGSGPAHINAAARINHEGVGCSKFEGNMPHNIGNGNARSATWGNSQCSLAELSQIGAVLPPPPAPPPETDAEPPEPTEPKRPRGFSAEARYGQVRLVWGDLRDGSVTHWQYRVRIGEGSYGDWTEGPVGARAKSHLVTGLENGREHAFQVRAVNEVGNGTPSREARAVPSAAYRQREPGDEWEESAWKLE